ncbi:hypothetical protein AVEN_166778-1 [Araneus ventricosus]|uniref:Uncharacterized protein n=1 Tax=Araneus ventricosus TaxID=182803 RepID=A0A4Y2BNV0_ARAVE|nr:hypothetical protein AVEN_166778-1 [Araneus ventricosus]
MLCKELCPFQCNVKFSKEQCEKLFDDFYKLNVNSKNALLYNCISKVNGHRQEKDANKHRSSSFFYMVKTESKTVRVCKTALAAIFNIARGKIDHIQKLIKTGHSVPPLDVRGKHTNRPHKITSYVVSCYIEDHIRFPCEELHYSRTKNTHKKYLSSLLSLKKIMTFYPVNEGQKSMNRKKNGVVLKFGTVVGDSVLNNILKVPARGLQGAFSVFLKYLENYGF